MSYLKTAIAAYNDIKENGLLKGLQLDVYNIICHKPNLTIREICKVMIEQYPKIQDRSVCARVVECRDKGIVAQGPNRKCSISGREVATWVSTCKMPKATKRDAVQKLNEEKRRITKRLREIDKRIALILSRNHSDQQIKMFHWDTGGQK